MSTAQDDQAPPLPALRRDVLTLDPEAISRALGVPLTRIGQVMRDGRAAWPFSNSGPSDTWS